MQTIVLTVFWTFCILWAIYYWYWSPNKTNNNIPKVVFDFDSINNRHSISSIESIEHSDNERKTRRKNMQRLKCEIKTRWPSKTSIRGRSYKSF